MITSIVRKVKNLHNLKTSLLSIHLNWLRKKSGSDNDLPSRLKDNAEFEEPGEQLVNYRVYKEHKSRRAEATY